MNKPSEVNSEDKKYTLPHIARYTMRAWAFTNMVATISFVASLWLLAIDLKLWWLMLLMLTFFVASRKAPGT